jgi:hypothetical protein
MGAQECSAEWDAGARRKGNGGGERSDGTEGHD